jgi:hypothetical protein
MVKFLVSQIGRFATAAPQRAARIAAWNTAHYRLLSVKLKVGNVAIFGNRKLNQHVIAARGRGASGKRKQNWL